MIHSLEREKIAKKLNDALETEGRKIQVLIQVNIDQEESKSGINSNHVIDFANNIDAKYTNLILKGLMFMPKINQSKKDKIDSMKKITLFKVHLLMSSRHVMYYLWGHQMILRNQSLLAQQ